MSIFNYTLPSGAEFIVRGPAGATQAQADRIFYEQVAAGSLIGYKSGQTLTAAATKVTKFELSRLDRGTAGVDTVPVLAIVQGIPVARSIPNLNDVPLTNPIDQADIVSIKTDDLGPESVGPLDSYQVQKILAQIANLVDQESDQISQDKGIGRYGFTAYALEQAGYIKPGTSDRFFSSNPEDFVAVMSSPSVWTGWNGVYSLDDVLNDSRLQNNIQVSLMQQGYQGLLANGTIVAPAKDAVSISTGQVFTNTGFQSIGTLTALSLIGANQSSLNGVVQNALTSGTTLNRLLAGTNVNLSTIGSGAVNSLNAGLSSLGNLGNLSFASIGSTLSNQINSGIGSLVTNASKFGTDATALWAKAGNLNLDSLGTNLTTQFGSLNLTSLTGSLGSQLNNITGQLTNLVPGSFSNLTSNLDIFGKAGGFATNFANPLGNLNNLGNLGGLGDLGGLLTSGGGIGGALTGQLGNLGNLANFGNLGNLANLGNLGNLANLGNLGNLANLGDLGGLANLGGLSSAFGSLGSFASIGAVGDLFGGGGDLVSGTAVAGGFNNTVNRATVDAAFARIVGSPKVPLPTYEYPSVASLAPRLDIQQAVNFLQNQAASLVSNFGQTATA